MRVGVQLPEVERDVRWPEYLAMARAAEAAGFDSIWIGDHLLYRGDGRPERGPWEAWTLLAALAAATMRVELGPLVACAGFHAPGLLAKMAATFDEVSGGRFRLAVGAGWNETEFGAFGIPFDQRVSRFEESFAILAPLPAGAWNTWWEDYGNMPAGFAALSDTVTRAARTAGRDPADIRRSACVLVALDREVPDRPITAGAPPLEGSPEQIAAGAARVRGRGRRRGHPRPHAEHAGCDPRPGSDARASG